MKEGNRVTSILFAGVGGQGVLLSSEILSVAAMLQGFDVKKTEVHGVAQRGGTVMSHVRYGMRVYSPLTPVGEADVLVALEKLEGARHCHYVRQGGKVLLNDEKIVPTRYIGEKIPYPENIEDLMRQNGLEVSLIDARSLAAEAGSRRASNVVILGALSNFLDLEEVNWMAAIVRVLPEKLHQSNIRAFAAGSMALARTI